MIIKARLHGVRDGLAERNFGSAGGARQIFVRSPEILKCANLEWTFLGWRLSLKTFLSANILQSRHNRAIQVIPSFFHS